MDVLIILVLVALAGFAIARHSARKKSQGLTTPAVRSSPAATSPSGGPLYVSEQQVASPATPAEVGGITDVTWLGPFTKAGFTPSLAEFGRVIDGNVMAAARGISFKDSMPFAIASRGALIIQDGRIGLAVPDGEEIRVISRSLSEARLMVSKFQALQVVFGRDATVDGWTFGDLKVDTPQGRNLGDTLRKWIRSG